MPTDPDADTTGNNDAGGLSPVHDDGTGNNTIIESDSDDADVEEQKGVSTRSITTDEPEQKCLPPINKEVFKEEPPIDTIPTKTAVALPIKPGNEQTKKKKRSAGKRDAHYFFGCLCDCRRAVVIVNIINLIISLLVLCSAAYVHFNSPEIAEEFELINDDDQQMFTDVSQIVSMYSGLVIIIMFIGVFVHFCGTLGAMRFSPWMVMVSGVWYCIEFGFSFFSSNIPGIVFAALFAYPHFILVREIKLGIMTPENYPNVSSCCCV